MVNRIFYRIILTLFITCACFLIQAQDHGQEGLRIGLIADIQYADKADQGTRFYKASLQKLDESIEAFNRKGVDFTVILGDFVDEGPKDLQPILQRLDKVQNPVYKLLGNHDFESVQNPYELYKSFGMSASYCAVDTAGWRFIFLNTNELTSYATVKNTPLEKEYQDLAERLTATDRTNMLPWNGGIGREQMKWLEKQLNTAREKELKVIVWTHHPLLPEDNGHEALNNREILQLLSKHKAVKAVISGHNHKGAFAMYDGLACITLEGMVETSDHNAYGILTLFDNKLVIEGEGRLTSRVIGGCKVNCVR